MMIDNPLSLPAKHAISVLVVGAGGTGSQVVQMLGRIHKALLAQGKPGLMVELTDFDRITVANIGRQLFTEYEIGRFKSHVLIERMNRFYGAQWKASTNKLTFDKLMNADSIANVIITCVDNVQARIDMHHNVNEIIPSRINIHEAFKNHYWIDTGNTKETGQVILSSRKYKLPTVIDLYPNIRELEDQDDTPSCSLAEALDRQHLFINSIIAQVCSMLMWDICTKPILTWYGAYVNINAKAMIVKRTGREESDKVPDNKAGGREDKSSKAKSSGKRSKRTAAG